jgi:hypothetical protein
MTPMGGGPWALQALWIRCHENNGHRRAGTQSFHFVWELTVPANDACGRLT